MISRAWTASGVPRRRRSRLRWRAACLAMALTVLRVPTALALIHDPPSRSTPIAFPASRALAADQPPAWTWPLPPPHVVVQAFDPPAEPWLAGQRGVDLAGHPGERVMSSGDGLIGFAGSVAGVGVVTVISGPLKTTYEPVAATVSVGQRVRRGQPIGTLVLSHSQCAPAACLHWGLLRGTAYLDPLSLLDLEVVRLLPDG